MPLIKIIITNYIALLMCGSALAEPVSRGKLIYQSTMADSESVQGWKMEGPGKIEFQDGWMEMYSPEQKMHHVFWCPKNITASFIAEWEVKNFNPEAGLVIVFFAARGKNGEDIFDVSLPKRDGTFKNYTKGTLNSYHISYYANSIKNPARGHSNLRKNHGFHLVSKGALGIPAKSTLIHHILLEKNGSQIRFFIDGREVIQWNDDGQTYGQVLEGGKIGFRQMKWTRFRYRNFRVYKIGDKANKEAMIQ